MEDAAAPFAYSYDAAGRLAEALDAADLSIEGGFAISRAYDAAGHVSELAASSEGTRSYSFDLAGRLAAMTLPGQPTPTTFAYDASGLLSRRFLADGSVTSWDYDAAGRLASIATTMPCGVLSFAYERDADGNVTKENATRRRLCHGKLCLR